MLPPSVERRVIWPTAATSRSRWGKYEARTGCTTLGVSSSPTSRLGSVHLVAFQACRRLGGRYQHLAGGDGERLEQAHQERLLTSDEGDPCGLQHRGQAAMFPAIRLPSTDSPMVEAGGKALGDQQAGSAVAGGDGDGVVEEPGELPAPKIEASPLTVEVSGFEPPTSTLRT